MKATARIERKIALLSETARDFYAASPLERAFSPPQLVAEWRGEELSLSHRRETVERSIPKLVVRKRLNRNARENLEMVMVEPAQP